MGTKKLTMKDCKFRNRKPKGIQRKQHEKKAKPLKQEIPTLKEHTIEGAKKKKKEYETYGYFLWGEDR